MEPLSERVARAIEEARADGCTCSPEVTVAGAGGGQVVRLSHSGFECWLLPKKQVEFT